MNRILAPRLIDELRLRPAEPTDLDRLMELEHRVFAVDRISRRGFRRFLHSRHAVLLVATRGDLLAGYALVLFRDNSEIARLYSIAVDPGSGRQGVGVRLLAAAEQAAIDRERMFMRLEVHENNASAIARYRKSGYSQFGHHAHYYQDRGHALRFQKRLSPHLARLALAPPYFHQTTEFTCGPACVMMALAWADPSLRPEEVFEFTLWREATTIFMNSGPGGCEPYGLAVTLRRHGVYPTIHVSRPGPYFLDTVHSDAHRRIMTLTQDRFRRDADELRIPTHLSSVDYPVLARAFDSDGVAIVLVSGYHMMRRRTPHWVFAFGREGRHILVHDPAAEADDQGLAKGPNTYAVPWRAFEHMTRFGRDGLQAAILIWKGPPR